jgi:hypothetical protein
MSNYMTARQIKVPAFAFTMHTCILHYKKEKKREEKKEAKM